jgi:hypothetical protein
VSIEKVDYSWHPVDNKALYKSTILVNIFYKAFLTPEGVAIVDIVSVRSLPKQLIAHVLSPVRPLITRLLYSKSIALRQVPPWEDSTQSSQAKVPLST